MRSLKGMSYMDVIVGVALILIIFVALTTLLVTALKVSLLAKNHSIAIAVAESQMENVRSLTYANIGTMGGIPSGPIPQYATTTVNGVTLVTRTLIEYVDDPIDGLGGADTDGITTDYKRAKVTTIYYVNGTPHTLIMVSNFSPIGFETTTGGGTLTIRVVNAVGTGLSGASVRVINASTTPTIDVTTFSDAGGGVTLPGAPASSQYQVFVSRSGYSSSQTYVRDSINQNPTPGYLTVAAGMTTSGTFAIDLLSTLVLRTFSPIATTTYTDIFSSGAGLSANSNTIVSGGKLVLTGGPSSYAPSGTANSINIKNKYLASWVSASMTTTLPAGTSVRYHIRDMSGALLPDAVLTGNSGGFTATTSLLSVSIATYPQLKLSADLTTGSAFSTPSLTSWTVTYLQGPLPYPGISFSIAGSKSIGTNAQGAALVKTTLATSTDVGGVSQNQLEWDSYAPTLNGYDITNECPAPPYNLGPAATIDFSLVLATSTSGSMLALVSNGTTAIAGASVTLSRGAFTSTVSTDTCGNAYFGSLTPATDYSVNVAKSGFTNYGATNVSISGQLINPITLSP